MCLEVTSEECLSDSAVSRRIKIRVLDFAGLSLPSGGSKPVDLYALVTVQSGNRRLKTEVLPSFEFKPFTAPAHYALGRGTDVTGAGGPAQVPS